MTGQSWNMKKNKIADEEMGEGDFGWSWVIKYWEMLVHNPVQLEGLLVETTDLEGMLKEDGELEGLVGTSS